MAMSAQPPDRPKNALPCPGCGGLLFQLYMDDGAAVDATKLIEDEHGKYVLCANPKCGRQVRLVQPSPGFWIPAPKRGTK